MRRMRPQWSGQMRGAMGKLRTDPQVAPTGGEALVGPTEDDEKMERMVVEGRVWEGEAKREMGER